MKNDTWKKKKSVNIGHLCVKSRKAFKYGFVRYDEKEVDRLFWEKWLKTGWKRGYYMRKDSRNTVVVPYL